VGIRYALKKDNCEYVLLLNNDAVVEEKFLNELIKGTTRNQNVGIIGGKILYYNEPNKIWYAGGKLDLIRGSGYHKNYNRIDKNLKGRIETSFVTGCLMLINKELLNADELLFEEYFLYVEDVDFCYSLFEKGIESFVNLDSVIYHKISSTINHTKGISPDAVYYLTRNRLYFMLKRQKNKIKIIIFLLFFGVTRLFRVLQWLLEMKKAYIIATLKGIKDGYGGKLGRRR
jgi:GT2 family glycosyltransferase